MGEKTIMEVTTFNINSDANPMAFAKRDAQVESDFTSKQSGFIKRQSAVDEKGSYVVIVYWENLKDADASMSKFMGDKSVADYAQMIDAPTMKMSRYAIGKSFNANSSDFVEVMSFDTKSGIDMRKFDKINQKVETGFTSNQDGFLQRITGVDEQGKQVVAVYWDNKTNSDAALQPFMENPISKKFMGMMNESSIQMGRYQTLTALIK
ncbi:MAG: hypothetical protein AB8B69_27210 [Chitinophagales bacterium]